ncbi:MAG: hypothetical protein AAF078_06350 [Planctomycetota bacterium]
MSSRPTCWTELVHDAGGAPGEAVFRPPSREAIAERLASCPPRRLPGWLKWVPFGIAGLAVGAAAASPAGVAWLMPIPVLAAGWALVRGLGAAQRQRTLAARRVRDRAMLRRHADVLRAGWRALPAVSLAPTLWVQTVLAMGESLAALGKDDAAAACFEAVVRFLPKDHPALARLRVYEAITALRDDRLADADDGLRRARSLPGTWGTSGAAKAEAARFELEVDVATLYQRVRTHHFADGAELADRLRPRLGAQGVQAAAGHALGALCYLKAGRADDAAEAWADATALVPAYVLVHRFEELAAFTGGAAETGAVSEVGDG